MFKYFAVLGPKQVINDIIIINNKPVMNSSLFCLQGFGISYVTFSGDYAGWLSHWFHSLIILSGAVQSKS